MVKNFLRFPLPYLEKKFWENSEEPIEGIPLKNAYNNHYSQMKPYTQARE